MGTLPPKKVPKQKLAQLSSIKLYNSKKFVFNYNKNDLHHRKTYIRRI